MHTVPDRVQKALKLMSGSSPIQPVHAAAVVCRDAGENEEIFIGVYRELLTKSASHRLKAKHHSELSQTERSRGLTRTIDSGSIWHKQRKYA